MRDTRVIQMRELARDIKELAAELLDEQVRDPRHMVQVACVERLASDIVRRTDAVYREAK